MKPPGCYYYFDPCRWKVNCDSWKFVQSLICLVHKIFALRDIPWLENVKKIENGRDHKNSHYEAAMVHCSANIE